MELLAQQNVKWDIQVQPWSFVTLRLYSDDIDELALHLQKKLSQAPSFFKKTPIILAFDKEMESLELSTLQKILAILERYQLHLSACSGPESWGNSIASFFNIPYLPEKALEPTVTLKKSTETIIEPLRAGQQFYAQGDVIALAKTHSGSEIITQGNIHSYARAQGRLLAGINGDTQAKIFCQQLEAELLSIAGVFMTKLHIPSEFLGQRCVVSLVDEKIVLNLLEKEII